MDVIYLIYLDADYRLCIITWYKHQQLQGYKVEEKLHLRGKEHKGEYHWYKLRMFLLQLIINMSRMCGAFLSAPLLLQNIELV
jgi:hypothetical protein